MSSVDCQRHHRAHHLLRDFVGGVRSPNNIADLPDFDVSPVDGPEEVFALHYVNLVPNALGDGHTYPVNRQAVNVRQFDCRSFYYGDSHFDVSPLPHARIASCVASGSGHKLIPCTPQNYGGVPILEQLGGES